ncbi:MAG: hypothetical protein SFW67_29935 [Myxococcaceae bacterium]|nr:hypothetical protein [Myxococcaceae bacterium]
MSINVLRNLTSALSNVLNARPTGGAARTPTAGRTAARDGFQNGGAAPMNLAGGAPGGANFTGGAPDPQNYKMDTPDGAAAFQKDMAAYQQAMNNINLYFTTLTNVLKSQSDTATATARNIR